MRQEKDLEQAIGECLRARDMSSEKARLYQVADELRKRLAPLLNGTAEYHGHAGTEPEPTPRSPAH
jgi:hypothetical protein